MAVKLTTNLLTYALLSASFFLSVVASVSWQATPFNPASIPLAVRSPYLSAWLPQGAGAALNAAWPTFWTGSVCFFSAPIKQTLIFLDSGLGWLCQSRRNNIQLARNPRQCPRRVKSGAKKHECKHVVRISCLSPLMIPKFTSTQSTFVMTAGPVDLTINFLSPIEPNDLLRQSLPFAYMGVSVASNDGNPHSIQLYSDISAEWVTGDNSLVANWSTSVGSAVIHQVQLENQHVCTEASDHIQRKYLSIIVLSNFVSHEH